MNADTDRLWDGRGDDPELERLEALLRPLGHQGEPLPLDRLPAQPRQRPRGTWWLAVVAAAAAALAILLWDHDPAPRPGEPLRLAPDAAAQAVVAGREPREVQLGALATVTLAPGTRLRFEHWRPEQILFHLEQGRIGVQVAPPPAVTAGVFQVTTRHGRVVDQGCRYELTQGDDGLATVRVTEGAVTFEFPHRTVFVPAAAMIEVADQGPSTPTFLDTPPVLRKLTRYFDELTRKGDAEARLAAAEAVVRACRDGRDTLVLWHLLRDDEPAIRAIAEAALLAISGPPQPPAKGDPETWPAEVWLPFLRLTAWTQAK